ncbi:hypothetical protein PROFUN_08335 [Planoprotostelium fungivorum]|uniref:Radical S-adenosyl methionine domain-containing protein 1, mitochondrial n=1 Tax=Planoprotostelium fungivorum TaxID=1890364 RepID=A0A2P6NI45_9EUKA|nr:hypothetical protein PROFUN_08335 [Planoprotostelium fungivorum]
MVDRPLQIVEIDTETKAFILQEISIGGVDLCALAILFADMSILCLTSELEHFMKEKSTEKAGDLSVVSVYFGGGTPSLARPKMVGDILSTVKRHANMTSDVEITLEANPKDCLTSHSLEDFKTEGINRVSLGVQSIIDDDLKHLGRFHSSQESREAIDTCQKLFDSVSVDLICGRHQQKPSQWREELRQVLDLHCDHLSIYNLTIEKGTKYDRMKQEGKLSLPDENESLEMYRDSRSICQEFGLKQYEVSSYGRDGHRSKHNLHYWKGGSYIGIGPGACGRWIDTSGEVYEMKQMKHPTQWMKSVESIGHGTQDRIRLEPSEIIQEYILFNMRKVEGIKRREFEERFKRELKDVFGVMTEAMREEGLIVVDEEGVRATDRGREVLDAIMDRIKIS